MRLRATFEDGEPVRIKRPQTIAANHVAFEMEGSTAVLRAGDAADLPEVVDQVEQLNFVQAVNVDP